MGIRKSQNTWGAVQLVVPFFKQYRTQLALGLLALLLVDFLQLWIPRVIKHAVDELQRGVASDIRLLKHGIIVLLLAVGIAVLRFFWRYFILGFSRRLETDLRAWMFSHLLTLDRAFFQRRPPGEIMALSSNDLTSVQLACGMGLVAFTDAIVMTLAALLFMAYIHPLLTLISVAPMPVLALLTRMLSARLHRRFHKVQEQFSKLTEFVRTTLVSARLVKAYTQESFQSRRFDIMGMEYVRDNLLLARVQGVLFPASGLIGNVSMLLVIFFGGSLTIKELITAGDFVAFINYLFMLTWPMMALGWVTNLFQRGVTSLDRIQTLIQETPALKEPQMARKLQSVKGHMEVRKLSFSYGRQLEPVLKDVTVSLKPGLLGVAGRTGSGKTTLCQLLTRMYSVDNGCIFLEGMDVNELPLSSVRGCIAYVPQDVFLFSDTIAANIAMGRPDATQAEIEEAARAAVIHDEILAMKDGYHARIGERGVKISGGQRQRIALARALLMDRPILIIDDGLSAVDTQTEHLIIKSIAGYAKGRACMVVSHRVAPLVEADEIIVMDHGRIIERGNHEQLICSKGFYASIYKRQMATKCVHIDEA